MTDLIEYRVRPVTRYIVTRYEMSGESPRCHASLDTRGEFDNYETAYAVAYALCKADHDRLGYPPDDMRIQYPHHDIDASPVSVRNEAVTDPTLA